MAEKKKPKSKKIEQTGLRCPVCADEIYSNYTHDFKHCKCGAIFIDGGFSYLRYGWEPDKIRDPGKIVRITRKIDPAELKTRKDRFPY